MTKKLLALLLALALIASCALTVSAVTDNPNPDIDPVEDPIVGAAAYYVVGTFSDWEIDDAYKLTANAGAEGEEYVLKGLALKTTDQFKVVSYNASILDGDKVWYPDGFGNNYGENGEITADNVYNIYFRPNGDGGDEWYYNVIYAEIPTEPIESTDAPTEEPTAAPTDAPTEEPTEKPVGSTYYYLVGTFTDWEIDENYVMFRNTAADTWEYYLRTELAATDQFKVVAYNGVDKVWYPDGIGNDYGANGEITENGVYTVYFRPNGDGGDEWFYQVICVEFKEPIEDPSALPTEAPTDEQTEAPTDVPVEDPTGEPIVGAPSYYVVGTFTDWEVDEAYKMTRNTEAEGEEYSFAGISLLTTDQFKVVSYNASILDGGKVWYPDGIGNNYGENGEIAADGTYTVYFRPNGDGGEDWFYNCIYVETTGAEPVVTPGEARVIAAWTFDPEGKNAGDKLSEYGSADEGYAAEGAGLLTLSVDGENGRALEWSDEEYGENGDQIVPIFAAGKKNPWGSPYIQIQISSVDCDSLTFTASFAGSNKAPAAWQLSYSTDGETFTPIEGAAFTLSADKRKELTVYLDEVAIPAEAMGAETLYLRLTTTSTATVAGGSYTDTPTGGEIALNNLVVKAVSKPAAQAVLLGDADGDGSVTILDANTIQRVLANLSVSENYNEAAAKVTGEKELTILDATFIQRWLAGIEVEYAINEPIA